MCNILIYRDCIDARIFFNYSRGFVLSKGKIKDWDYYFQRLPIQDILTGNQPYQDKKEKHLFIFLNGEVYNRDRILEAQSEVELIAELYKKDKRTLFYLQLLKGEFAYVIIDLSYPRIIFYRSFPGVVPLYYSKDIISTYKYSPKQKPVQPGIYYIFDLKRNRFKRIKKNYSIDLKKAKYEDLKWQLEMFWDYAISDTHVPKFIAYSGGLDSSIIAALFPYKKIAVVYPNSPEHKTLKKYTDYFVFLDKDKIKEAALWLKDLIPGILDNPIKFRGAVRNYWVARMAKAITLSQYKGRHSAIVIGGEGADELFGGYPFFDTQDKLLRKRLQVQAVYSMQAINLDRTNLVPYPFDIEWRVPFLYQPFIEWAFQHNVVYPNKQFLWSFANYYSISVPIKEKYGYEEQMTMKLLEEIKKEL